jgi:hypothetical protein
VTNTFKRNLVCLCVRARSYAVCGRTERNRAGYKYIRERGARVVGPNFYLKAAAGATLHSSHMYKYTHRKDEEAAETASPTRMCVSEKSDASHTHNSELQLVGYF